MSTLIKLVDKLREKRALGNEDTELKAAELEPLDDILNVDGSLVRHMHAMISPNLIVSRHNSGLFGPGGYIWYRIARIETGAISRAVKTDALGTDCLWSSDMLYPI